MIADALRTSIEQYARARSQNPVYALAEAGTLSATTVARYIANVHYIIQHTLIHLARARDVARARGDERLAMHYQKKLDEEQGHDAWSQRDLDSLARLVAQKRVGVAVTSAMRKVAANNSAIITRLFATGISTLP